MKQILIGVIVVLTSGLCSSPSSAIAQQALVVKPLAEKKVTELPAGPLFWRIENFPTLAQAQAAAGPTGLVVESGGKVWLFTLGAGGWSISGRHQGCRSWTTPARGGNAVSPSDQRSQRSSRQHNARAHASGLRSVLRARRGAKHPYVPMG